MEQCSARLSPRGFITQSFRCNARLDWAFSSWDEIPKMTKFVDMVTHIPLAFQTVWFLTGAQRSFIEEEFFSSFNWLYRCVQIGFHSNTYNIPTTLKHFTYRTRKLRIFWGKKNVHVGAGKSSLMIVYWFPLQESTLFSLFWTYVLWINAYEDKSPKLIVSSLYLIVSHINCSAHSPFHECWNKHK